MLCTGHIYYRYLIVVLKLAKPTYYMENKFIIGYIRVWHLCYYYTNQRDRYSNKLLNFKNGIEKDLNEWLNWAKLELVETLEAEGIKIDYVIRVLGSQETIPLRSKPVAFLARNIASEIGARYIPRILSKKHNTAKFTKLNSLDERINEISGVYQVSDEYDLNGKNILIVDDITTSGTTLRYVRQAILRKYKNARFYGFCLGKTSYDHSANENINARFE